MEPQSDVLTLPHVRDYLFVIIKRKKVVVISVIVLTLIGLLSIQKREPVYVATVQIMIETGEHIYTSSERLGGVMYDYRRGAEKYENEYDLMESSDVINKTAEMLGMEGEVAANYIRSAVQIKPIRRGMGITNTAYIAARSKDPQKAMDMANYTARAYIKIKEIDARDKIKKTYEIYSHQLQELKNKLKDSEMKFNEFKKEHDIVGEEEINLDEQSAQNLGAELVDTRIEIDRLHSLFESVKELKSKGTISTAVTIISSNYPNAANRTLQEEIIDTEKELLELTAVYTDKHPLVIQKKFQLEGLNKQLEDDLEKSMAHLNATLNMLKAKEENIMYSLRLKNPELGAHRSEYFTLKEEVTSNRDLYNNLIASMKELDISEDMSKIADVKVLEWAKLPLAPEKEGNMVLLIAPFLGLFLGITMAFFLEYMDNTIKTDDDIKRYLDIPVIGVIPHMESEPE